MVIFRIIKVRNIQCAFYLYTVEKVNTFCYIINVNKDALFLMKLKILPVCKSKSQGRQPARGREEVEKRRREEEKKGGK